MFLLYVPDIHRNLIVDRFFVINAHALKLTPHPSLQCLLILTDARAFFHRRKTIV